MSARSSGRGGIVMPLVALLLALCVGALGWSFWRAEHALPLGEGTSHGIGPDAEVPDATPTGPPVVVAGRILLEVALEPEPEPEREGAVIVVGRDTAKVVDDDEGDTDGGTGMPSELEAEPEAEPQPPAVTLEPPEAGSCRISAWRDGTRIAGPVTCDDEGRFEVVLAPGDPGPTAFELEVPGRLRAVVEAPVPASGRGRLPTVALGIGQTVRGQVHDGRAEPVAGIEVQAMPIPNLGEAEPWRATTDDAGAFVFDTLPPGPVAMRAAPDGFAPAVVEAIAPQDDVLVTVDALIDLRGAVVGPSERVASARVRLEGSGIWPALEVPVTADGRFSFTKIPDGVYALQAYVRREVDGAWERFASIPLENVTPDLEATLALIPAAAVPIDVVGPEGDPVSGARVSVGNSQIGLLARVATTDEQGRAMVGPLVPGDYVARADADDMLPSHPAGIRIEGEGAVEPVVLQLLRPGQISGIVVDEAGHAIDGATVLVGSDALYTVGESQARADVFRANLVASGSLGVTKGPVPEIPRFGEVAHDVGQVIADADGRFVLRGLTSGRYTLQAVDGRFAASTSVTIPISAGTVRGDVRLVLRRGFALTGRVLDGNGRPVVRATVELGDGTAYRTDRRGLFDAGLRRGTQVLVARAEGKAPARREVTVRGPTDVELTLPDATGRLDGRAEDGNGQPVEDARVTIDFTDGLSQSVIAWTDARGLWAVDGLPAGEAHLEVVGPGFVPYETTHRVESDVSDRIDVVLATGWSLEVVVIEAGRRDPVAGARVRASGRRGVTDCRGEAELTLLSEDEVEVRVEAAGFGSVTKMVRRPDADDRAQLRVELTEGGEIRGRVTDYRGDPVPGSTVVVRVGDAILAELRTDAAGRWAADGIPEGDVVVEAFAPPQREDELAEVAQDSDVLRGRVTKDVELRFDRR